MKTENILSLLSNLSRLNTEKEIHRVFCETMEIEFPELSVSVSEDYPSSPSGLVLPIKSDAEIFAYVIFSSSKTSLDSKTGLLEGAVAFLSVILENRRQKDELFSHARRLEHDKDRSDLFINSLMNALPTAVYIFDLELLAFTNINEKILNYSGYTPAELIQMEDSFLDILIHQDDREKLVSRYKGIIANSDTLNEDIEYRILRRDGSLSWVRCRELVYRHNEQGFPALILGTAVEITDIKESDEERNFVLETARCINDMNSLYNLQNSLNEVLGFLCIRLRYIIDVASVCCIPVSAYAGEEPFFGSVFSFEIETSPDFMNFWKNIHSIKASFLEEDISEISYKIRCCSSEEEKNILFSCLTFNQTRYETMSVEELYSRFGAFDMYLVPLFYEGHVTGYYIVFSRNRLEERMINHLGLITDKVNSLIEKDKRSQELERSLEEKNILLQEIHHRVKNNMQIISSLLKLQSANQNDRMYEDLIDVSRKRIAAMALVHEKLYQSDDFSRIEFGGYMRSLVDEIKCAEAGLENIKVSLNSDSFLYIIEKIVPCGLIINELMTNSVKHAFPDVDNPEISIEIRYKEEHVSIVYKDNGKGKKNVPPEAKGLGLNLVHSLIVQLRGEIEERCDGGLEYRITIPHKD